VPHRTELPVAQMCARLLEKPLEPEVEVAIIESVFDYREREWYGNVRQPPRPGAWDTASSETLRTVLGLAAGLRRRENLPPSLVEAISRTVVEITEILAGRAA